MKACDWSRHFNLQKKSGMTIEKYCKANGSAFQAGIQLNKKLSAPLRLPDLLRLLSKISPKRKNLALLLVSYQTVQLNFPELQATRVYC